VKHDLSKCHNVAIYNNIHTTLFFVKVLCILLPENGGSPFIRNAGTYFHRRLVPYDSSDISLLERTVCSYHVALLIM
jgi:hypothetical protein